MIEVRLGPADLARVRFAHSPARELVASLQVIGDRRRHHVYRGWLTGLAGQLDRLRLDRLRRLAELTAAGPAPTFLTPTPALAWGTLADELATIAATPPAMVRDALGRRRPDRPLPPVLRPLYEDPESELPLVIEEMSQYWRVAVEPIWQRLRALCMADVHHRSGQFTGGGVARVLSDLHPAVSFAGDRLLVDDSRPDRRRVEPGGAGLVLVPCAFGWPGVAVGVPDHDPVLIYPPRGVALLEWPAPVGLLAGQPAPLCALVGRTRATLLVTLGLPATTTQLARQLNVSAAAISQHLKILTANGLAVAHRRGKLMLYQRTAAGTALLAATGPSALAADHAQAIRTHNRGTEK